MRLTNIIKYIEIFAYPHGSFAVNPFKFYALKTLKKTFERKFLPKSGKTIIQPIS